MESDFMQGMQIIMQLLENWKLFKKFIGAVMGYLWVHKKYCFGAIVAA